MPIWLSEDEMRTLRAVVDRLIPAGGAGDGAPDGAGEVDVPGALECGAAEYIDGLLGAFVFDPPRIWAGGAFSGRHGGEAGFSHFHELSRLDELAWRTRIEGSDGISEREFNGPVVGLQQKFREGLGALGADFATAEPTEQEARLKARREFVALVFPLVCEGMYGAPEYGGNRDLAGWKSIGFEGDIQPRGWSDAEVAER